MNEFAETFQGGIGVLRSLPWLMILLFTLPLVVLARKQIYPHRPLLIAMVAKNAILIVEFAAQRRSAGDSVPNAAIEAARLRFRPILMTALSFVFGTLPLAFATGAGAAGRQSIGTTVIGGMLVATAIGVVLVPVFYFVIQSISEFFGSNKPRHEEDCSDQSGSPSV